MTTPQDPREQGFELDPILAKDTVPVTRWPLCDLRLMNDCTYPWLVLIPRRTGARELHDLSREDRTRLMEEVAATTRIMQQTFKAIKMNAASLGNRSPQVHFHVIARSEDDPAWPGPVWRVVPPEPYEPEAMEERITRLKQALAEPPA